MSRERNVLIRADGGLGIGAGHVERCLVLARGLRGAGARVDFLYAQLDAALEGRIDRGGFRRIRLGEPPQEQRAAALGVIAAGAYDVLVVDHYGVGYEDEAAFAAHVDKLVVIEDLPGRRHHCDVLIDQTVGRTAADYRACVPWGARLFLGADHALIREEFRALREKAAEKRSAMREPRNLLISFGGSNPDDVVVRLADLLVAHDVHKRFEIRLVQGLALDDASAAGLRERLGEGACIAGHVDNMHELVLWADVAIGAAGVSTWERCVLGLPTILVTVAANQTQIARNVIDRGAAFDGGGLELDEAALLSGLACLESEPERYREMSRNCFGICDGAGAERVCAGILQ